MFNEHYRIKLVSEVLFEVTGKLKPHTNGNSSEARDEEPEDENKVTTTEVSSSRCGVDVILDNHLVETFFEDKEQLCTYLTAFMEKLVLDFSKELRSIINIFISDC